MESSKWQNISKKLQTFNIKLFLLSDWIKIIIAFLFVSPISIVQVYLNLKGYIPVEYQLLYTPLFLISYFVAIKTIVHLLWNKYVITGNDRVYHRKTLRKQLDKFGKSEDIENLGNLDHPDDTTKYAYHRFIDVILVKCENCGYEGGTEFHNHVCPICTHKHEFMQIESGQPCNKHIACYAHRTKPCEGCGRTNMEGEVWVTKKVIHE